MSPTLDLVNDCFRFVTGFFEAISISSPHIYHSALPLSPKMSTVWRLYEQYAHPLTRIIQGVPMLWDPVITSIKCSNKIIGAMWSPCNRFIAVAEEGFGEVQILDAVTLKRLKILVSWSNYIWLPTFSPKSHLMMCFDSKLGVFFNWDIQTGVLVSEIPVEGGSDRSLLSITYSICETMFGALFGGYATTTIVIYNVLSCKPLNCHLIEGVCTSGIWTHGECVQFATLELESITIWEVEFTSEYPPKEVGSLPTPTSFDPLGEFVFLPSLFRLAFLCKATHKTVFVWDAQYSKLLLCSTAVCSFWEMDFSSDGHFFICRNGQSEIYFWKESQTGYIPYQKFQFHGNIPRFCFSPDGQSFVIQSTLSLQLWHTTDLATPPSNAPTPNLLQNVYLPPGNSPATPLVIKWLERMTTTIRSVLPFTSWDTTDFTNVPTQTLSGVGSFVLGFSPDGSLAVVARKWGETAAILDLKSGILQMVVDAGIKIDALGVNGSTIIAVGNRRIITWNLPSGDCIVNARINTNDSVQMTRLDYSSWLAYSLHTTISPNLDHIAITFSRERSSHFVIFDVSTGKHLASSTSSQYLGVPRFTPDGCELWCYGKETLGWAITKGSKSGVTLTCLNKTGSPSGQYLWKSPNGHQITDNGWILSSGRKQLLWLPPYWQSSGHSVVWGGQFLALLHHEIPEPVILELLE